VVGLIRDDAGRVLLGKRPPGLLGGLWEPPMVEVASSPEPTDPTAPRALEAGLLRRAGLAIRAGVYAGEVMHVFTHRRLTARAWLAQVDGPVDLAPPTAADGYEALAWSDPSDDLARGRSRLAEKLLALRSPSTARREDG
jgi:adenine-specific DNA glycosylase